MQGTVLVSISLSVPILTANFYSQPYFQVILQFINLSNARHKKILIKRAIAKRQIPNNICWF